MFFCSLPVVASSQTKSINTQTRVRLYFEISKHFQIESECLSLYCITKSTIWKKADSLMSSSTITQLVKYTRDESPLLKYYSFIQLLKIDDNKAFQNLHQFIGDTTKVLCHFDDYVTSMPFNELIFSDYEDNIHSKYYFKSIKVWTQKQKMFCSLIKHTNITSKYYCN